MKTLLTKPRFANIPTEYNGINFRSRLEARWATFFDQLRWEWEYEPFDLQGWIPDFLIKGEKDLLVEVKPYDISQLSWEDVYSYFENEGSELPEEWKEVLDKITTAKPSSDVLLLGNNIHIDDKDHRFGIIVECAEKAATSVSLIDSVPIVLSQNVVPEYLNSKFSYGSKRQAMYALPQLSSAVISEFWKTAGNITQWEKPER